MDRTQFLDTEGTPWWLIGPTVESDLEAQRIRLGEALGWNDPLWFNDPARLTELYEVIERIDAQLLTELDYVVETAKQVEWLQKVLATVAPAPEPSREAQPAEAPNEPAAGDHDRPPTTDAAAPGAEAPVKKSIFAKKRAAEADAAEAATSSGGAAARPETAVPPSEAEAPVSAEEVQQAMAALDDGIVADLAQTLDMEPEALSALMDDDEFRRMVAEEVAKLS